METLVTWLIRSVLVSGLMLGYYCLALRNRRSHSFNRVWFLMTLIASLVLPFLRVGWLTWHTGTVRQVVLTGAGPHPAAAAAIPLTALLVGFAVAVGVVLLAVLIFRITRLYRIKHSSPHQAVEGCCLIEVRDHRAPFSFLSNLFWQEGADISDPVQRKIFDHELAHIRGGHTYDILFAQLLTAVFWMNPFFWLIRRELQMVHEFIADERSVGAGGTETFALMLLRAYDGGRYLDPSHHFFHSPIKRRLRMISSSKPPSPLWKALALPVLLGIAVLACSKEQNAPAEAQIAKKFQWTVAKLKLQRDSAVQLALSTEIKKVFLIAMSKAKKEGEANIQLDTLGTKMTINFKQAVEVTGQQEKVPPPPPPQPERQN